MDFESVFNLYYSKQMEKIMKNTLVGIVLGLIAFSAVSSEVVSIKTQSETTYEFVNPYRPGEGLKRVVEDGKYGAFNNVIKTDENELFAYNTLSCVMPKTEVRTPGQVVETIPKSGFYKINYPATGRHGQDGNCFGVYRVVKP